MPHILPWGKRWLYGESQPLFTENETNYHHLYGVENASPYVKDGIHNYIVNNQSEAVNPDQIGTKAAVHYTVTIPAPG